MVDIWKLRSLHVLDHNITTIRNSLVLCCWRSMIQITNLHGWILDSLVLSVTVVCGETQNWLQILLLVTPTFHHQNLCQEEMFPSRMSLWLMKPFLLAYILCALMQNEMD
ncbi:uncharacterized protein LOC116853279 [Odontomachus brunneus]|uniref:uncharacterized protein LOC116853279 n=1 Tax=Odontomachus brunneus TaxID=486640 RepID=UPI0013F18B36|nr:uncharacterized protein LOC116853279 [Odontomachus brunneus]